MSHQPRRLTKDGVLRYQRRQFKVRLPQEVVDEVKSFVCNNRSQGWTQDQFVQTAIHAYLHESSPDEILYRRLDRMQLSQEKINDQVRMIGQVFFEYMYYWFRLWPESSGNETLTRRKKGAENLIKWLQSLKRAVEDRSGAAPDILDTKSIDAYLKKWQEKTELT